MSAQLRDRQQQRYCAGATRPAVIHARLSPMFPGHVVVIPVDDVAQLPSTPTQDGLPIAEDGLNHHLFVCPSYQPEIGSPSCAAGPACPCVHANLARCSRFVAHEVPKSWKRLEDVSYPRYAPDTGMLRVAAPNRSRAKELLAPETVLVTRALDGGRDVSLNHCAHFVRKGSCDFGAECRFVHALRFRTRNSRPSAKRLSHDQGANDPQRTSARESAHDGAAEPGEPLGTADDNRPRPFMHDPYNAVQRPPPFYAE